MLCWRRISAIGTPASPCFKISTIWLSVNRDFRMGISLAPESLRSKCLPKGEAYEGIHPDARPAESGAARSALGARRKAIHLPGRAREADTRRPLRGTRPARGLSRDVQPRHGRVPDAMDGGRTLLRLLVLDGQLQRNHRPPESPRHHDGRRLTSSLPEACRLQEEDGLEL